MICDIRRAVKLLAGVAVPESIGRQNGIVFLTGILHRVVVHPGVDLVGSTGKVTSDPRQGLAQGRFVAGILRVKEVIPVALMPGCSGGEIRDRQILCARHRTARIDGDESDAESVVNGPESVTGGAFHHLHARAVVGIPVREIGHLFVVAAACRSDRTGAVSPGIHPRISRCRRDDVHAGETVNSEAAVPRVLKRRGLLGLAGREAESRDAVAVAAPGDAGDGVVVGVAENAGLIAGCGVRVGPRAALDRSAAYRGIGKRRGAIGDGWRAGCAVNEVGITDQQVGRPGELDTETIIAHGCPK